MANRKHNRQATPRQQQAAHPEQTQRANSQPARATSDLGFGAMPNPAAHAAHLSRLTPIQAKRAAAQIQRSYGNQYAGQIASAAPLIVQPKLTVTAPNDQYEQEADRVAGQVLRQIQGGAAQPTTQPDPATPAAQVMRKAGDESGAIQRAGKRPDEQSMPDIVATGSGTPPVPVPTLNIAQIQALSSPQISTNLQSLHKPLTMQSSPPPVPVPPKIEFDEQMRPRIKIPSLISPLTMQRAAEQSASGGMSVPASIESAIQSARGGGQALPENTRAAMEGAIGADFGGVRVHTGGQSDTLNEALSARAFTTGQDIFFRQGEYAPQSGEGQKLLAHELTHVVQQEAISNSIANSTIQRSITDYTSFNKEIFQSLDSETGKRIYLYTNIGPGTNFDNQIRELYLNAYNTYMSYSQPDTDELKLALNNLHEALKIHEHKISLWDKISWSKMSQNSNEEIYAALQQFEDLSKSYKDLEEKLEPLYSYKNKNNNNISDEAEKVFKDMKKQFNQWNGQRGTRGAWYGSNQPGNTTGAQRVSPSVVTELKQLTQNTTWQFQTSFSGGLSFHRTRGNIDFIYHMDLS